MNENQNIEWKSSWRDEYLKWVCAFANEQGGRLFIGKDDTGTVVHLSNFKKLLEDIPAKIKNYLGIICSVLLKEEATKKYIEIEVKPYSVPVSYNGKFYIRSGSTTTILTGIELTEFLLKKTGKTWDDVIVEDASIADIDGAAIQQFIEDSKSEEGKNRMPDTTGLSNFEILDKLRLVENKHLKRAALILFANDPNRFFSNCKVMIGRFRVDSTDLIFQEVVEGNLIHTLHEVITQLNHKFLIRKVDFKGMLRIEQGEYPLAALREMLLNALVHKKYMGAATIQLRVFDDRITIWNEGKLPEGLNAESLLREHSSRPRNPFIADACFKAGYIDTWGRGTLKIINTCTAAGLPTPQIIEKDGGIEVTLFKQKVVEPKPTTVNPLEKDLNARQLTAIKYLQSHQKITNKVYQEINKCSRSTASTELAKLVEWNIVKSSKTKGAGASYELN